jgi:phage terminase large subunit GpA-like protein
MIRHVCRAWQNLMLGEPYEDAAAQPVAVDWLAARAENDEQAPKEVCVVTAGRLEVELVGFGVGDESWSLDYRVLYGDPSGKDLWEEVALLRKPVSHQCGRQFRIRAACIDSGGHHTVAVYNFVRDKQVRSIWACKGASRPSMPPWPRRPVRVGKNRVTPLYLIGVDSLKDAFMARLRIEEPGAGFCHFPVGRGLDYYVGSQARGRYANITKVWRAACGRRRRAPAMSHWTVGSWPWRRSRVLRPLGCA